MTHRSPAGHTCNIYCHEEVHAGISLIDTSYTEEAQILADLNTYGTTWEYLSARPAPEVHLRTEYARQAIHATWIDMHTGEVVGIPPVDLLAATTQPWLVTLRPKSKHVSRLKRWLASWGFPPETTTQSAGDQS